MSSHQPLPQLFDTVIVRFGGEIGIKAAWTRKLYERRLMGNVKAMLKHYAISYEALDRKFGRLYIKTLQTGNAVEKLAKVLGISSVSPAVETTSKLTDISNKSVQIAGSTFKKESSFAVRCRRVGTHDYTSQDVCRQVGRRLLESFTQLKLRVNLKTPDATLCVEVREDKAYIYTETVQAAGGLPLGTQPKVVGLINGDLNSLVACWLVMKRGCPVVPLYLDEKQLDAESSGSVSKVVEHLFEWAVGFSRKVYVVSLGPCLTRIVQESPRKLKRILSKRLMYRIAEHVAEMEHAEGLVTGESVNQQAAQTLHVLSLQDEAARKFPVYRPLTGFDKAEIQELAQRIGVTSVPVLQKTKKLKAIERLPDEVVALEEVEDAESKMNVYDMVEAALKSLRTVYL